MDTDTYHHHRRSFCYGLFRWCILCGCRLIPFKNYGKKIRIIEWNDDKFRDDKFIVFWFIYVSLLGFKHNSRKKYMFWIRENSYKGTSQLLSLHKHKKTEYFIITNKPYMIQNTKKFLVAKNNICALSWFSHRFSIQFFWLLLK